MNFKTKTAAAGILAVLTVAAAAFVILPRHKKLPAPAAVQADKILVKKAERKLYLQKDGPLGDVLLVLSKLCQQL